MPANYVLLEKITVGAAGAANVTFSNIPQTGYTDLVIKASARTSRAAVDDSLGVYFNADTTNYDWRTLSGNGSAASSTNKTSSGFGTVWVSRIDGNNSTSSTFANVEIYIPNYTSANQKSYSVDGVTENNATEAYANLSAILFSSTAAISSITVLGGNASFVQYSTFSLYGVAALGTTPVIAPKATGGDIIDYDGTYWIHTFLSSGTFTPAVGLTCDYLVVAGGGGGGAAQYEASGGGGAGGLRCTVTATGGGGSLESALTLNASTNYTVTVGAGGAVDSSGNNSIFNTVTSTAGGKGGRSGISAGVGGNGGSGGGGAANASPRAGGTGTTNQGYAGGAGNQNSTYYSAGAGGGAGAIGTDGNSSTGNGGNGGAGVTTSISGTSIVYAGGGGGGTDRTVSSGGVGGTGGGGNGAKGATAATAGTTNRGAGGGGGRDGAGAAGGSGIVIVRYLAV
jgi:hypothetical protein